VLLNGEETRGFSHGLKKPFELAQSICGDLLPSVLVPHRNFYSQAILSNYAEPSIGFVERIETEGDPSNRYRHFGVHYRQADLHKLDDIYFALRRTAFPLSMSEDIFGSYRLFLEKCRSCQLHDFDCLSAARRGKVGFTEREAAFKWQNFAFCEEEALAEGALHTGYSITNSVIYNSATGDENGREAVYWLLNAAKFSKDEKRDIQKLIDAQHKARD
jgi:hypothetical protein